MKLPPLLAITPLPSPDRAAVTLPGSKSITNRALVLAALSHQPVTLRGALFSRDTEIMTAALRQLGFTIAADADSRTLSLHGNGGTIPTAEADLSVGNAGTVARFLTAFLCLHPAGSYRIDGDPAMRRRPMRGLIDALTTQGATFSFPQQSHHFPFIVQTRGVTGGALTVDAGESSQILSALLMIAPLARHPVTLHLDSEVRPSYIQMTLGLMQAFGQPEVRWKTDETSLAIPHGNAYRLPGDTFAIEADASAASYFLALPLAIGGSIHLPGMSRASLQGDTAFANVLEETGLLISRQPDGWISQRRDDFKLPTAHRRWDFRHFSDTFMTLAALTPLLPGTTTLHGISHTRLQECDRIEAMADGLRRLGQSVTTDDDSITVKSDPGAMRRACADAPITVATHEDHRIAMSFAILGCHRLFEDDRPWLAIEDPACCGKTFPSFFSELAALSAH